MVDDEEAVQDAKRQSGHGEEVDGCDGIAVTAKEGSPALASVVGRRRALLALRMTAFSNGVSALNFSAD
jgi:hypothetical protein